MLDNVGELGDVIFHSVMLEDIAAYEGKGVLSQIPGAKKSLKNTKSLKSAAVPNECGEFQNSSKHL